MTEAAGKTVAILATDGFEETELTSPQAALVAAGATPVVVSLKAGGIEANRHRERGDAVPVDAVLDEVRPDDFDALVIPGGLFSPDALRTNDKVLGFVRAMFEQKKPVAAICHGPQVLISAGVVKGRRMTAVAAVRDDLRNAGADVVDEEVVVDDGLVTSRTPDDLDAFNAKLIEELAEGRHPAQAKSVPA